MLTITAEQVVMLYPTAYLTLMAIPLIYIDLKERRLPNKITLPFMAIALVANITAGIISGQWTNSLWSVLVAFFFGVAGTIMSFRGWIGMGDVKLSIGMFLVTGYFSLWFSLALFLAVLLVMAVAISIIAWLNRTGRSRRETLALGPYLIGAFLPIVAVAFIA